MTASHDRADATAILGLMNLPRVGTATIHRILDALAEDETTPRHLLGYAAADLIGEGLLTGPQATAFASAEQRDWRVATIDHLDATGIRLLPITSDAWPACLRKTQRRMTPPLLMARGNVDLLHPGGIAVAGARKTSVRGLEITRALVAAAVEQRFTIVSGGAAGTDAAAHEEALARGGSTIVVLAEGICAPGTQRLDALLETGRAAVVSTFLPDDPWQAWRAMERNHSILGLCDRLVVIEAGDRGGTLAAGREALDAGIPTWVLAYADPPEPAAGNRLLIELGARPIPVPDRGEIAIPPELFAIDGWVVNRVRTQDNPLGAINAPSRLASS
jgi:DNA processing protein